MGVDNLKKIGFNLDDDNFEMKNDALWKKD